MQQTILALAAILIFSLYALSRHSADNRTEEIAFTSEVETAAVGIARARLHAVTARGYDEADLGREGARMTTVGLTPSSQFGPDPGETTEASWDDVDDYHGQARPDTVQWNGRDLVFRDSVSVSYYNVATGSRTSTQSMAKEITVVVTAAPVGFIGRRRVAARLRRIVTPASDKTH